jgi:hypothetical protein
MVNITPRSNRDDLIGGSMEFIDWTDSQAELSRKQIKRQREINLFLFWCLGVVSVYALLF